MINSGDQSVTTALANERRRGRARTRVLIVAGVVGVAAGIGGAIFGFYLVAFGAVFLAVHLSIFSATRRASCNWWCALKNGGTTLEMKLTDRGIQFPTTSSGWDALSTEFAAGASGNLTVLQAEIRIGSTWARIEFNALRSNQAVTSITAIDPATNSAVLLWIR